VLSTAYLFGGEPYKGYIVKPGVGLQPFPVDGARLLGINAAASKIVYEKDGLHLFDLRTGTPVMLLSKDRPASNFRMSHDGRRLLFLEGKQVHLLDTGTLAERVVAEHPDSITNAVISGNGRVAFAVTGAGGLLRINLDDGAVSEWIGRTPYLDPAFATPIPGLATTLNGSALSDSVLEGTPPFNPYLGNLTMWMGERKMPVIRLTPGSVTFLFPWDASGLVRILAEVPGRNTPFDFPAVETTITERIPRAGALARQDWTQTYVGPVKTGEVIHVYAIGFGPVLPEVPDGAAAPSQEPLAHITNPFTCSNAEILYAGLAPGTIERVYQIDIRIGATAGYQQFVCKLGDAMPFVFLTLNVVP
jgi:uncharacterized protein (TIGR03437 family)